MDDRPNMSMDRYVSAREQLCAPVAVPLYRSPVTLTDRDGIPYTVYRLTSRQTCVGPLGWCVRAVAFWLALGALAYGLWCA